MYMGFSMCQLKSADAVSYYTLVLIEPSPTGQPKKTAAHEKRMDLDFFRTVISHAGVIPLVGKLNMRRKLKIIPLFERCSKISSNDC